MVYTKEKVLDKVAKAMLEQFLENMVQEAMETQDSDRELLLMSCYFVGCEALKKETFMVIDCEDLPQKYILVPGIPFDITETWAY